MSFAADVSAWVDVSVAARAATRENGALIKGAPEAGLADRGRSAPSTDETFPAFNNRTRARCRDRVGLRSWLLHREGIMRHSCRVPAWCSCRRLRNAWVRRKRIWPHRVVRGEICVLRTTARYLVAPPSGTPEAAPPGPHKADSDVCHLFSPADVALITVVAGPTPSTAWRSGDCLEVVLGSEMLAYLKSNIYEVTVTCGVDVLLHSQGLDANNQRCAL